MGYPTIKKDTDDELVYFGFTAFHTEDKKLAKNRRRDSYSSSWFIRYSVDARYMLFDASQTKNKQNFPQSR